VVRSRPSFYNSLSLPIAFALENGHHNVTDFLLALPGAAQYISHQDAFGRTPLHYAAMNGSKALIQILFKCPSIAEAFELQDDTGQTPLDWAVSNGNSEALILLQEAMYA
jgi:ankyrin repeat protein